MGDLHTPVKTSWSNKVLRNESVNCTTVWLISLNLIRNSGLNAEYFFEIHVLEWMTDRRLLLMMENFHLLTLSYVKLELFPVHFLAFIALCICCILLFFLMSWGGGKRHRIKVFAELDTFAVFICVLQTLTLSLCVIWHWHTMWSRLHYFYLAFFYRSFNWNFNCVAQLAHPVFKMLFSIMAFCRHSGKMFYIW